MSEAPPRAPERFGPYSVVGVIATGSKGVVYRSVDPQTRQPVAIRAMRRGLTNDEDRAGYLARLNNEALAGARLTHPGIVTVLGHGGQGDEAYVALELVDGGNLRQLLDLGRRFGVADAISLLSQLLEALQFTHDKGIWHRDVQPANILITRKGRVKIGGLSLARVDPAAPANTGATLGTPGFIAPEVYLGGTCDQRVDIFGAGVLAYRLLAGGMPFPGPMDDIMYKVCYQTPVALSVASNDPSLQRFDEVVTRALTKRAKDRYASAAEFRDALAQAFGASISPTLSEAALPATTPPGAPAPAPAGAGAPSAAPSAAPSVRPAAAASSSSARIEVPGWDPERLAPVERHLARFIGPVARVMVKRAAAQTRSETVLLQWLAEYAVSQSDRAAFLQFDTAAAHELAHTTRPPTPAGETLPPGTAPPTRPPRPAESAEAAASWAGGPAAAEIARAGQLLTPYLGPIAPLLARRAAAEPGMTRARFLQQLASQLGDEKDRAAFLAQFPSDT